MQLFMIKDVIKRTVRTCEATKHLRTRVLTGDGIRYYLHVTWLIVSFACVISMLVFASSDWSQVPAPQYRQAVGFDNLLGADLVIPENLRTKELPATVPKEMNHTHIWGIPMEPVNTPQYKNNVFFSVKTTDTYFTTRLLLLMLTWFQVVSKDKLSIVSDAPASDLYINATRKAGFNLIVSDCVAEHSFRGLCCKTGTEFAAFYEAVENDKSNEKSFQWYCHADDDIYMNIPQLSRLLKRYDPKLPHYIGKYPSAQLRKSFMKVDSSIRSNVKKQGYPVKQVVFHYATGATYCISYELMMQAKPYLNGKEAFETICQLTQYPDDMAIGFIINVLIGRRLTDISSLANQYDKKYNSSDLLKYVSISYDASRIQPGLSYLHTAPIVPQFKDDPTRFLTYHCRLFPSVSWCH